MSSETGGVWGKQARSITPQKSWFRMKVLGRAAGPGRVSLVSPAAARGEQGRALGDPAHLSTWLPQLQVSTWAVTHCLRVFTRYQYWGGQPRPGTLFWGVALHLISFRALSTDIVKAHKWTGLSGQEPVRCESGQERSGCAGGRLVCEVTPVPIRASAPGRVQRASALEPPLSPGDRNKGH